MFNLHYYFFNQSRELLTSSGLHPYWVPYRSTFGSKTFIRRGPLLPRTLVSYWTTPCWYRRLSLAYTAFLGPLPLSKIANSVPKKFDLTFPKYPVEDFSIWFWSALMTYFDVALPLFFFPASKNLFESESTKLYLGHSKENPDFTLEIVVLTYPTLGGTGFINIYLSSSGFVH